MKCSFEETISLPGGVSQMASCANEARILATDNPCYGLCYTCAYRQLQTEVEKLKKFARYVIESECWSILDLDGGDIQDLAEKLGLIEPHTATEEDVDDSTDYEMGDTIYRFTETLKG